MSKMSDMAMTIEEPEMLLPPLTMLPTGFPVSLEVDAQLLNRN